MISYKFIIIPFISLFLSQLIKFLLEYISIKRICIERLFNGSGGMPSTHSAFVSSLTMLLYLEYGLTSSIFAIGLIFSLIVVYDSISVRYETEKQSMILNNLIKKFNYKTNIKLKEKVGHNIVEVICGIFLGIAISLIFYEIL